MAAVPDVVFIHDNEGQLLEANQLACDCVGYSRDQLLSMSVLDIAQNFNLEEAQFQWCKLEAGQTLTLHWQMQRGDGHEFLAEVHLGLLLLEGQRVYVATVREQSSWQGLQNALRLSEERYQQAARAAQCGIFSDNLVTCQVYWSKEFRNIVGVDTHAMQMASGGVLDFVHPDDQEFVQMAINHARDPSSDGKLDSIHRIIRECDGALRWVQVIGKVVFSVVRGKRRATEINGLLIDITDRMQVKQELLESQQRFELALNASPVTLFEQDAALRYTWHCNSNLGFETAFLMGKTDAEIMDAQAAQVVMELKRGVLLTGMPVRQELAMLRRDGSVAYIDVTLRARRDARGDIIGLMGTGFDVTEARNAKVRLEELNAEMKLRSLEAESVNVIRSRFLSTVSHELRTPLHTLLGYLRLAMLGSEGEVREHLQIAERSGRQLLKQIGDLLSFNRLDKQLGTLQPEAVELRSVIEQIERTGMILAQAGTNRFSLQLDPGLPKIVHMDEYRLMQVLDNLISNACKFTRAGDISLQISRHGSVPDDAQKCRLRFSVQDSGTGMEPKDLDKIFEPFVRLEGNQLSPGLGLGLSIARQWVRAMGSDIEVESTLGQGSRFAFVVDFPEVSQALPADVLNGPHAFTLPPGRVCTLLVVDDVEENRRLLRQVCTQWGCQVAEADGVTQALARLNDGAQTFDAVLVDQWMVGCSGWDLLRQLRQQPRFAAMPVALISASDARRPRDFPAQWSFDLVMGKPLDYQVLVGFVCEVLGLTPRADELSPTPAAAHTARPRTLLASSDLQNFRQLLDLGRVVRIAEWAQDLAHRDHSYHEFSEQVVRLAQAADLFGLERLVQQLDADVRTSTA